MSHFHCKCGKEIADQSESLPYKGHLFPNAAYPAALDKITDDITKFLRARLDKSERQWVDLYFGQEYGTLRDESIIWDICRRHLRPSEQLIYQCPSCRRIWIERADATGDEPLSGFAPEETSPKPIFQ